VGAIGLTSTGVLVFLAFQSEGSKLCSKGGHGTPSSCVCWEAGLTTKHQVIESGAMWRLQSWGIGTVELQVVLPILPMTSCFFICGFG
jgi:hypothetical protein